MIIIIHKHSNVADHLAASLKVFPPVPTPDGPFLEHSTSFWIFFTIDSSYLHFQTQYDAL